MNNSKKKVAPGLEEADLVESDSLNEIVCQECSLDDSEDSGGQNHDSGNVNRDLDQGPSDDGFETADEFEDVLEVSEDVHERPKGNPRAKHDAESHDRLRRRLCDFQEARKKSVSYCPGFDCFVAEDCLAVESEKASEDSEGEVPVNERGVVNTACTRTYIGSRTLKKLL